MGWTQGSAWDMLRAKQPWSWNPGVPEAEPGMPGMGSACDGSKSFRTGEEKGRVME